MGEVRENILKINLNELVPVFPTLLVRQADSMADFMDNVASPTAVAQNNVLTAYFHPDLRQAAHTGRKVNEIKEVT